MVETQAPVHIKQEVAIAEGSLKMRARNLGLRNIET